VIRRLFQKVLVVTVIIIITINPELKKEKNNDIQIGI